MFITATSGKIWGSKKRFIIYKSLFLFPKASSEKKGKKLALGAIFSIAFHP